MEGASTSAPRTRGRIPGPPSGPSVRSELIPRPVPRILPATTGLRGLAVAFHNFIGRASSAADTLIEAEHQSKLKKIERENAEQRRRATVKAIMTIVKDVEKVLLGATKAFKGE